MSWWRSGGRQRSLFASTVVHRLSDVLRGGRPLLGLSAVSPNLGVIIEDLLHTKEGLEVVERSITKDEMGRRRTR